MLDIVNEIQRMRRSYYEQYGKRGKIICLDANAEVRLAVYMACDFDYCNNASVSEHNKFVRDILENGIRHLYPTICGMKIKFDCLSFCIEPTGQIGNIV